MEGSTSSNNVRWNPTKEQISILEALYSQGMRTPTADQIQRITSRLRCYGHIEGKNVFYWFQNHKARQRQKEKQRHHGLLIHPQQRCLDFAYVNRRCLYFHNSTTVAVAPPLLYQQPPASSTNHAMFGPCYAAQNDMFGYNYAPHPNVILPLGSSERRMNVARDVSTDKDKFTVDRCLTKVSLMSNETLDLFPVHPTGIPLDRKTFPSANRDDPAYSENCACMHGESSRSSIFSRRTIAAARIRVLIFLASADFIEMRACMPFF